MADPVREVDYWYVEIPNRPGEGLRILSALKEARVSLLAFCGFPLEGGRAQIDLVPEDPAALPKAIDQMGLKLSSRKRAFLVQGEDRLGAAADIFQKLGSQGIQIVGAQALGAGSGRWAMILWVPPADYERAGKALKA